MTGEVILAMHSIRATNEDQQLIPGKEERDAPRMSAGKDDACKRTRTHLLALGPAVDNNSHRKSWDLMFRSVSVSAIP